MSYNLHPLFVHFPIALLFLYSFIKIIPLKKWWPQGEIISLVIPSKKNLTHPILSGFLALVGLVAIVVTGLLGGVMVYGPTADPAAGIVLRLLGLNY